jgi:hypothetical protein
LTLAVPAIVVPAFALTLWWGGYLLGRDPGRPMLWRGAGALVAYGIALVAWSLAPASSAAETLLCLPALVWAGTATALLPREAPERWQVNRGWLFMAAVFAVATAVLPGVGKLVALAPLAGALVLLAHYRDGIRPGALPAAFAGVSALYALGLVVVLAPIDLGSPALVLSAIGLDMLLLGFLIAVADAVGAAERLVPDLRRALVPALGALLLCAGPVAVTLLAVPDNPAVTVVQFVVVGVVMFGIGAAGPVRQLVDRLAFLRDDRLRVQRLTLLRAAEALTRRDDRLRLGAIDEAEFRRLTLRALDDYRDDARLLRNPLVDLPAVDQRLHSRSPGLADHPLVRVAELRSLLEEHVERLKPAGTLGTAEDWRFYNALRYGCVLGLKPYAKYPDVEGLDRDARRIVDWFRHHVPRATLRRWKTEGADMIAVRLWRDLLATRQRDLVR